MKCGTKLLSSTSFNSKYYILTYKVIKKVINIIKKLVKVSWSQLKSV